MVTSEASLSDAQIHCHILPHMIMGMQSVFVVGGESLPELPKVFENIFVYGGCFECWNNTSIGSIEDLRDISFWGIGEF